jgi:hypothetical protein
VKGYRRTKPAWQARDYPIEFRGPAVADDARILNAA